MKIVLTTKGNNSIRRYILIKNIHLIAVGYRLMVLRFSFFG